MDRQTVYAGQIPLETDQLKQSQNAMVGLAKLAAGVLGTSAIATGSGSTINAIVNGFTCTPTSPASLNVIVTAGEIYQIANLEQSAWSSLSSDTHSILKQGILLDPATFGITPPGTVGYSQNFLIEVQYQDTDSGSTVLPYYNSANPSLPFSGPGNAGTAQNTVRKGVAALQVKAGTAATSGTQTTPTPDVGWTGLFVVTVANGATTITSGNISTYASAPLIPVTLPNVPNGVQTGGWLYAADSGAANNMVVTLNPAPPAYTAGLRINVKVNNSVTGATVINVNGLGNKSVVRADGSALTPGNVVAGQVIGLIYDGTNFQIQNIVTQNFRASTYSFYSTAGTFTWTAPANVTQVKARVVGAGGGGGAGVSSGAGAGGNGGAYGEGIYNVTPGTNYTVTVGAGGGGGTSVSGNGGAGGTTSFGSFISITGGGGGSGGNAAAGATSTASTPTVQAPGIQIQGFAGQYGSASASTCLGGNGGSSVFASPTFSPICFASSTLNGYTNNSGGGGSGGASTTATWANGGAGGAGVVILEY